MLTESNPVWFITGCSSGFGNALARYVLDQGGIVVATARNIDTLRPLAEKYGNRCLTLTLDVTKPDQISDAVAMAKTTCGAIDILVNNAGVGYISSFEDGDEDAYRALFEINYFGALNLTRAVLPGMREKRTGHIVNISSQAGFCGWPSSAFYSATKFALSGASYALADEVAPLGIAVTLVEPSGFKTDFTTRSLEIKHDIHTDYEATVGQIMGSLDTSFELTGDPYRAAEVIVAAVNSEKPPLHLPLGPQAFGMARATLKSWTAELDEWQERAIDTDFR